MSILLLGAKGQLGFELQRLLTPVFLEQLKQCAALEHTPNIHCLSRQELDLSDLEAVSAALQTLQPQFILNASAYTAVDKAETHPMEAMRINHLVPEVLARYASSAKAVLVHFSTDFVFDGLASKPYTETDPTAPLSVYGQTKRAGEEAITASGCQSLIFRTGWLMGAHGQNFLKTMLKLARDKTQLKVVNDQLGAPTSAKWLASTSLSALITCMQQNPGGTHSPWGLYHASSEGTTSWHAYAKTAITLAEGLGFAQTLKPQDVLPIQSVDYPLPAKRPAYSVLSGETLTQTFRIHRPLWTEAVLDVLQELKRLNLPL